MGTCFPICCALFVNKRPAYYYVFHFHLQSPAAPTNEEGHPRIQHRPQKNVKLEPTQTALVKKFRFDCCAQTELCSIMSTMKLACNRPVRDCMLLQTLSVWHTLSRALYNTNAAKRWGAQSSLIVCLQVPSLSNKNAASSLSALNKPKAEYPAQHIIKHMWWVSLTNTPDNKSGPPEDLAARPQAYFLWRKRV
jgi:hypothetical protein